MPLVISPAKLDALIAGKKVMRVQIPAYCDAWMRGDRYGNVVKVTWGRKAGRRYDVEIAHVLLDKSNKVVRVNLDDCEVL